MRKQATAAACAAAFAMLAAAPALTEVDDPSSSAMLPDPLIKLDGKTVTDKAEWFAKRRPELKGLFESDMYGKAPAAPERVTGTVERVDGSALGGKATLKEIRLDYGPAGTPPIHLLLIVPNGRDRPAPTFVGLNFYGNHTVLKDLKIALPTVWVPDKTAGAKDHRADASGRGFQAANWDVEEIIGRGYALATFYCGDLAPDHPGDGDGVPPHYPASDWGAVSAWAWGASRVADYLANVPEVDPSRLAVIGHSRLGKAALLAGAFDDRFAIVFSHQAGCGGSAPSRGTVGESVTRINTAFPHWFNAKFKTYNDRTDKLPFDQNALVALVAPRPVLFTNAVEDTWANPHGQFEVLREAEGVYKLLGAGGLASHEFPAVNTLSDGTLGYAIRPGKHSMAPEDWAFFLAFADKHFARAAK